MKRSRWFALSLALSLLVGAVLVASAFSYRVKHGDTLFGLARQYGTTVSAIAETNYLADPDKIYTNQTLEIPSGYKKPGHGAHAAPAPHPLSVSPPRGGHGTYMVRPGDTLYGIARHHGMTVDAIRQANDIRDVSYIRVGELLVIPGDFGDLNYLTPTSPDTGLLGIEEGSACARINFLKGLDRYSGSPKSGTYVISEFNGRGGLASWKARAGDVDSGWIEGINITFPEVHVVVTFYPDDGSLPVLMQIVNPAPDSQYGWMARDTCHAIEVQYPYYAP